jgi:hypothetical protein
VFYSLIMLVLVYSFYVSLAVTEGWKWRINIGKEDNHSWVNAKSYHVWRAITNLSFVFVTIGTLYGMEGNTSKYLVSIFILHTSAWLAYERTISFIQEDSFLAQREDFKILSYTIKRVPVELEVGCFLSTSICYLILIFV